tara:strand:+ start:9554 stop:10051 length:498 start_codon:yes stop_codon:yes gene_type:complete
MFNLSFAQSSASDIELYVEKNRNYESTFKGNANFKLVLKNTSAKTTTYHLSTTKYLKPCSNEINKTSVLNKKSDKKNSKNNIDLNSFLLNSNKTVLSKHSKEKGGKNKVVLNGGQSYKFNVSVIAPEGTPYNRWGCIEVKATEDTSELNTASTILSVFVPDPTEF